MRPRILAISTYCEDTCIYSETGRKEVTPGGPALWIVRALEKLGVTPEVKVGDKQVTTEVTLINGEPLPGKLFTNSSKITLESPVDYDGIIINFLDDFDILQLRLVSGTVLLDIAPYTRVGPLRQQKAPVPLPPADVRAKISIMKANHEEFPYIPAEWVEEQKSERILLHTLGKNGVDLWDRGTLTHLDAKSINAKNVLGAGDTFGSSFLFYYLTGGHDAVSACQRAMNEVYEFLLAKNQEAERLAAAAGR